jgi:hypothetical protein
MFAWRRQRQKQVRRCFSCRFGLTLCSAAAPLRVPLLVPPPAYAMDHPEEPVAFEVAAPLLARPVPPSRWRPMMDGTAAWPLSLAPLNHLALTHSCFKRPCLCCCWPLAAIASTWHITERLTQRVLFLQCYKLTCPPDDLGPVLFNAGLTPVIFRYLSSQHDSSSVETIVIDVQHSAWAICTGLGVKNRYHFFYFD